MASLKFTMQEKNTVRGSCAKAKKAAKRGALDKSGKPSPEKFPGLTRPIASYNGVGGYKVKKTREGKFTCNQDGKTYKSEGECFKNC